jgi:hypothetical protein
MIDDSTSLFNTIIEIYLKFVTTYIIFIRKNIEYESNSTILLHSRIFMTTRLFFSSFDICRHITNTDASWVVNSLIQCIFFWSWSLLKISSINSRFLNLIDYILIASIFVSDFKIIDIHMFSSTWIMKFSVLSHNAESNFIAMLNSCFRTSEMS